MKNKLAALLATLLLSLSLLPTQALAVFSKDPGTPAAISEQDQPETPDPPDDLEDFASLAPLSGVSAQSEEPDSPDTEH